MTYRPRSDYRRRRRINWLGVTILSLSTLLVVLLLIYFIVPKKEAIQDVDYETPVELNVKEETTLYQEPEKYPKKFYYDSGIDIPYPEDGVKGIYMSAYGYANANLKETNINLIKNSNLNAIVVDVKDDWGTILFDFESTDPWIL